MADEPLETVEGLAMSFGDHLEELRTRLIHALIGVGLVACVTLYFGKHLVAWLCVPLFHAQRQAGFPAQIEFFNPTASLTIYLKVSFIAALIIGSPWVVYQIWMFVSAGLYASERKIIYLLTPFSAVMCTLGVLFAYYVLLPVSLAFFFQFSASYPTPAEYAPTVVDRATAAIRNLVSTSPDLPTEPVPPPEVPAEALIWAIPTQPVDPVEPVEGQMWIRSTDHELRYFYNGQIRRIPSVTTSVLNARIEGMAYLNFVTMTGLGIVIGFQLPVVMLILGWTGIVEPAMVARSRRYCVFGLFVLAAILTPQDLLSMFLLAVPLWLLFEFGLVLMRVVRRRMAVAQ